LAESNPTRNTTKTNIMNVMGCLGMMVISIDLTGLLPFLVINRQVLLLRRLFWNLS
jgi:hypothetical protein